MLRVGDGRTNVNVTKSSQALAELFNLGLVSLGLVAILILGAALLFNMESQILKENNSTAIGLVNDGLDLGANAVGGKCDALAKQLLELGNNGLQRVLWVGRAVGTTEVGHQDDGLGAIVDGMLDGGDSTNDTLVVGDLFVLVERDVEVDLRELMVSL